MTGPLLQPPAPGGDACDAELAAFFWKLIGTEYLDDVGWNHERRILTPPTGHPTMGPRACPVIDCDSAVKGKRFCATCSARWRKSGLSREEYAAIPRTGRKVGVEDCRVPACGRPALDSGKMPLCRAHRYQFLQWGGTLKEFLADPQVEPLPGFGDCGVLACTRPAATDFRLGLCDRHSRQLSRMRRAGNHINEQEWLRTAPSGSYGAEISFRGLPDLVIAQLLFGLKIRCQKGARTDLGNLRALIDRTIRPASFAGATRSEQMPQPERNQETVQLLNGTRTAAVRACKTPESEYTKDVWDLAPFGHRGNLTFTKIGQPWLRQAAKRWARDYLSTVRSRSTNSHVQQHLHGLASLSETLRARPDRGLDPAALGRPDIENWLNRTRFLQEQGVLGAPTRWTYLRHVRHVLRHVRALGLTRAGEPMAGLPDDFVLTKTDIPKPPSSSEEAQDLPPEVMRVLCAHLDELEDQTCREMRVAVELLMDTGRRPEEVCKLRFDCLSRDRQGKPVLIYDNFKEQRIRRELPIHEPTAVLIRAQQEHVRRRFPDRDAGTLVLLPVLVMNPRGDKSIGSNHLSNMHRDWVESLPEIRLDDGTVFDREKIFPYAYRHSFAQRHADAGVGIDVLAGLLDHDSFESSRCYYRIKEKRLLEAVDKVTTLQFDRHGRRIWGAVTSLLEAERTRKAIGAVVVPFGTCFEPSNVAAGGGHCPLRFRCVGCDHFSTDVSYLPDLRAYLDDLLRNRERLRSMAEADAWALAEAAPSDEEINRVRRLIHRVTQEVDQLTDDERHQIRQAAATVRKMRQGFLGMPRIHQPLPDLRPERPA
ncbi:tyrosine-type recombinase/integrase [Nonomuraea sp. NPDC059194]|uniref:tyrosine-type recombinase/integrase n=1 Tax=Nonomuraea sp. NPDC059194 TaxID=3346764 RepID=UPI0036940791